MMDRSDGLTVALLLVNGTDFDGWNEANSLGVFSFALVSVVIYLVHGREGWLKRCSFWLGCKGSGWKRRKLNAYHDERCLV